MPMLAGKYISEEDMEKLKKKISEIEFTEEDGKQLEEIRRKYVVGEDEHSIAERKKYYAGMPKVPDENTAYLNATLSALPPDHVFTDEELDIIATKAFSGMMKRQEYIWAHKMGGPNSFDEKERMRDMTDEEIIKYCERYAGRDHEAPFFKNLYNVCMGKISSREYEHDINKRVVLKKFRIINRMRKRNQEPQ